MARSRHRRAGMFKMASSHLVAAAAQHQRQRLLTQSCGQISETYIKGNRVGTRVYAALPASGGTVPQHQQIARLASNAHASASKNASSKMRDNNGGHRCASDVCRRRRRAMSHARRESDASNGDLAPSNRRRARHRLMA